MMKNIFKKLGGGFLSFALLAGAGIAISQKKAEAVHAEDYEEVSSITSNELVGSNNTAYKAYAGTDYVLTFGGNRISLGTNSGNRTKCNLSSYSKYAVSPVETSDVAAAIAYTGKTALSDVSRVTYSYDGGSNPTSTSVYLIYSADNATFSQVALKSDSPKKQGDSIVTSGEFTFKKCSGWFALVFKATNSSGNWRIDNVAFNLFKSKGADVLVDLTDIGLEESTAEITEIGSTKLTPVLTPSNANNKDTLSWSSDNISVATVDSDGVVNGVAPGKATITLTATDISKSASCVVTVTEVQGYVKVTSVDNLSDGMEIILVGEDNYAMSAQNGNFRSVVNVEISNGVLIPVEGIQFVTLESDGNGHYYFSVGANQYLYNNNDGQNYVFTGSKTDAGTKGIFNVTINEETGKATIKTIDTTMTSKHTLCANGNRFAVYGAVQKDTYIYAMKQDDTNPITSLSIGGTVSAKTGDTTWDTTKVTVSGTKLDGTPVEDAKSLVNLTVNTAVPALSESKTVSVSVTATLKKNSEVTTTKSIDGAFTYVDAYSIVRLYDYSPTIGTTGVANIVVDGIYMGKLADGIILMNGEYGIEIYYGTGKVPAEVDNYVVGETALTAKGTLKVYSNLYEIGGTIELNELTDSARIKNLVTPSTYMVTGSETSTDFYLGSRKTHATGTVVSQTATAKEKDNTVKLNVNGTEISVFIKSTNSTEEVFNKISSFVGKSDPITFEGFTSFHGDFQIQFTGIVEQKADYLAANFAADLLELTDEVCANYDGVTDNKAALGSVWLLLQDADHYLGLAESEQEILAAASASASGTDVEKAMARYDYLVAKYGLTNFIDRSIPSGLRTINFVNSNNNTSTIIIVIVSVVSLTTLGALIMIKRRKTTDK